MEALRRNGVLSAPEKMVDAVSAFALKAFDYVLAPKIQDRVARMERMVAKPWPPKVKQAQAVAARLRKEQVRGIKYKGKKLSSFRTQRDAFGYFYTLKLKTDFSDLGASYPWKSMQEASPELEVRVYTRSSGIDSSLASYAGLQKTSEGTGTRINVIRISLPTIVKSVLRSRNITENNLAFTRFMIEDSIRHELQHFVQSGLIDHLNPGKRSWSIQDWQKAQAGLGLEQYKDPAGDEYLLKKVEFFPWVSNALRHLRFRLDQTAEGPDKKPVPVSVTAALSIILAEEAYRVFLRKLFDGSPDRHQRFMAELSAFVNDYNAAQQLRWSQRRYLTPQRVVSEVLLDLDVSDRDLAAWLRKNRTWAENQAREAL